ncbi:UNVERIFIED_CONTAM: hypothetical protein FKN15_031546 [Acipenser sinensis]
MAYQSPPPLGMSLSGLASAQSLVSAQPNVEKLVEDHLAVQSLIRAYQPFLARLPPEIARGRRRLKNVHVRCVVGVKPRGFLQLPAGLTCRSHQRLQHEPALLSQRFEGAAEPDRSETPKPSLFGATMASTQI